MPKILGIDPGLAATGIGIVTGRGLQISGFSYGQIQTSSALALPARLDHIFSKLTSTILEQKPDLLVIEDVFSLEKHPKSGITLGKVTGVILLAGYRTSVPMMEIPVREVKKVLTGNGAADKAQLEKVVRSLLSLSKEIRPFHASDALGLAVVGLYRNS
jgi:crossover junction endodeoxyribonuclease RuvC